MLYHAYSRHFEGVRMGETTWKELCQAIMHETDPVRMFALANELARALDEEHGGSQASSLQQFSEASNALPC